MQQILLSLFSGVNLRLLMSISVVLATGCPATGHFVFDQFLQFRHPLMCFIHLFSVPAQHVGSISCSDVQKKFLSGICSFHLSLVKFPHFNFFRFPVSLSFFEVLGCFSPSFLSILFLWASNRFVSSGYSAVPFLFKAYDDSPFPG